MLPSTLETAPKNPARNDSEVLIRVENVGKVFCRDLKKSLLYGVQDSFREMIPWLKPRQMDDQGAAVLRPGEFWANKNISFELRRGECLGLIGRNGAGKTTLLKMLNGLIKPDSGSIQMKGRVGALIALGAGFNPILTGRENVYVNASILGITKAEIDEKMDDIIEFADIGDFIDSPVQSYSSGMQVRLGFAIATAIEPDVLILDEVLAVGDAAFRAKCYRKINQLRKKASVIFVSHNMQQVAKIADYGLLLRRGAAEFHNDVAGAIQGYFTTAGSDVQVQKRKDDDHDLDVAPTKLAWDFVQEKPSPSELTFNYTGKGGSFALSLSIMDEEENIVAHQIRNVALPAGRQSFSASLAPLTVRTGRYRLTACLYSQDDFVSPLVWFENCVLIDVNNDPRLAGTFAMDFSIAGRLAA